MLLNTFYEVDITLIPKPKIHTHKEEIYSSSIDEHKMQKSLTK